MPVILQPPQLQEWPKPHDRDIEQGWQVNDVNEGRSGGRDNVGSKSVLSQYEGSLLSDGFRQPSPDSGCHWLHHRVATPRTFFRLVRCSRFIWMESSVRERQLSPFHTRNIGVVILFFGFFTFFVALVYCMCICQESAQPRPGRPAQVDTLIYPAKCCPVR